MGALKKGAMALGRFAGPVAAGFAAVNAYQGFNADEGASTGQKLMNAGSSVASGLTFGLVGKSAEDTRAEAAQRKQTLSAVNDEDVKKMIMQHEGVRYEPYQDSLGKWTVGVGHLIGDGTTLPSEMNRSFSKEEVQSMFEQDYYEHKAAAERMPGYENFNSSGKAALIDLAFNMGPNWYKQWPKFSDAAKTGNAQLAAESLQDSAWYKQVGDRAPTIVNLISNGIQAKSGGIASGPTSGFPATLHGNEMIQPLDPNSMLQLLATTPAGQESTKMLNTFMGGSHTDTMEMIKMQASMIEVMAAKLDSVIDKLELGNDIQGKLLNYTIS
jgi:lysozyme